MYSYYTDEILMQQKYATLGRGEHSVALDSNNLLKLENDICRCSKVVMFSKKYVEKC